LGGLDRPSRFDEHGGTIDPPSRVFIDGEDTSELNDTALARFRNEKVGFVFQFHYLLKEFTAQENVALPMFKLGRLGNESGAGAAAMCSSAAGLADKIKRKANRLSGGEQQRSPSPAPWPTNRPSSWVDEPTGNLDRANSEKVAETFQMIADGGQTIVMVTHDPPSPPAPGG
jgi:lipoprotein-releasing system ATP-binding protein